MSRLKKAARPHSQHHSQSQHCTHSHSHSTFFSSNLIQTFSRFTQIYIDESSGENEHPDMNLSTIPLNTRTVHISHWTICKWTVMEIVNKEIFLWVEAECGNVEENKETREEKKPSGRMWYKCFNTAFSIFKCFLDIPETNVFFYSYRWVLRRCVTKARRRKGQLSDLINLVDSFGNM